MVVGRVIGTWSGQKLARVSRPLPCESDFAERPEALPCRENFAVRIRPLPCHVIFAERSSSFAVHINPLPCVNARQSPRFFFST